MFDLFEIYWSHKFYCMFVLPSGGLDHDDSNVCLDILYSMQMSLDLTSVMKMEEKEEEVWGK